MVAKNDVTVRALALDGDDIAATWTAGDRVYVYNETKKANIDGYLEADGSGAETTLSGDLTGVIEAGDVLTLKFGSPDNYASQEGTLDYIADNCDYATASVTVDHISGSTIVPVAATTTFVNQQAIVKFVLKDYTDNDLPFDVKYLVVDIDYVGGTSRRINVELDNPSNEIYVALPDAENINHVSIEAKDEAKSYERYYEKDGVVFSNGNNYYTITVKMYES